MQRERPGHHGALDILVTGQGRVKSRLRLFALLTLLVPLFAGLHTAIRDGVPRVEVRVVSQDVPASAPVVVPVERIVYVPVSPSSETADRSTSVSLGQVAGKAQRPETVVAEAAGEAPAPENASPEESVAASAGEADPAAAAEAAPPPDDAPVIGVVALARPAPVRWVAPAPAPAPAPVAEAVEPEAPAQTDALAEIADELNDVAMDEMEGAAAHLAEADLRVASTSGVPYAPPAPAQPAEAAAPQGGVADEQADPGDEQPAIAEAPDGEEGAPAEGGEAVAETPPGDAQPVAEEAAESPPATEVVVTQNATPDGLRLVTLSVEVRSIPEPAPAEAEVRGEEPAAEEAEAQVEADVVPPNEDAAQPVAPPEAEQPAAEDAVEQLAAPEHAEQPDVAANVEEAPDEAAAAGEAEAEQPAPPLASTVHESMVPPLLGQ